MLPRSTAKCRCHIAETFMLIFFLQFVTGLILHSNKRYSQTIQKAFHLTQAALDLTNATESNVQVWLGSENENYLLCNLSKSTTQVPLNLIFSEGDSIAFSSVGKFLCINSVNTNPIHPYGVLQAEPFTSPAMCQRTSTI